MARRSDGGGKGGAVDSTEHDVFQKRPVPRLPTGLMPAVRKVAKEVLRDNRHLEPAQVGTVIRFAQLTTRWNQLQVVLELEGPFVVTEKGLAIHPASKHQMEIASKIEALERGLAIQTRARRELLVKGERTPEQVPKEVGGKRGRSPRLRVA